MTENRYRPASPSRRYPDPRASTGMVYSSSFDTRFSSQPRTVVGDPYPSTRHGSYSTQGVTNRTFLDDNHPGRGPVVRTEYAVRPRNNSTVGSESRRPVSTYVTRPASPPRVRPVISTSRDGPRSPVLAPAREERYLMPAASNAGRHHHRHSSATRADQDRLRYPRVSRQPEYHQRGGYNAYPSYSRDAPLQEHGFSYTTPKEQFLQESSRPPQRRESFGRRERPISTMGLPEYRQSVRRDPGPPPASSRALDRIDKTDSGRHSGMRLSELDDRIGDVPRRHASTRAPVLHHYRDDGYTSARDEREPPPPPKSRHDRYEEDDRASKNKHREERDREIPRDIDRRDRDRDRDRDRERDREREKERERERAREVEKAGRGIDDRRQQRSRDPSPEQQSGVRKHLSTVAAAAVGAGVAGVAVKSSRNPNDDTDSDDHKEKSHRRRRHHRSGDDPSPDQLADRVERDFKVSEPDRRERRRDEAKTEDPVAESREDRRERRRHHRRHRDKPAQGDESDTTEDSGGPDPRQQQRSDRDREGELREPTRPRERAGSRDGDRDAQVLQQRTISPGEEEDDRPRRVQLVEPVEKRDEAKPKGILKPPRAVPFPEDPHPEREGVAPLKDAKKDGIPPNARWTKISRALVNPEALEKANERFEERDDYVIVLRVVTKEEIMKFAEKTKEIRESRERQWQAELEERRRRKQDPGYNSSDDYDTDDDKRPALAIEPGQPVQGIQGDPRVYLQQQQKQHWAEQAPVYPSAPGIMPPQQAHMQPVQPPHQGIPVPDIRIEPNVGNYATNV
ncbi:hypothetical protein LTR20_007221 [Exophiala xenobiotica]|nr:hypothetical protein LTS13_006549 [Exophiala xenobiotica]KAK5401082.1 hypothetical protein LTR79_001601 [Exophiala xenobiotica]KAK5409010.1 hypothetical protein LTR90_009133 [Exophiala xenobiotica]KAK5459914.1 hypothetical protein LTR20_007221 [Exophiala xenobiotica]KAK5488851.1 hypothetical protein LTR26_004167 [Exophiala xenobiotica]